jgi:hypothetical protein
MHRPNRTERTLLPAGLAAVLLALLLLQFSLPDAFTLPDVAMGRLSPVPVRRIDPVAAASVITERALFSPGRSLEGGATDSATAPLGGANAIGYAINRGSARLFLQDGNGKLHTLAIGGVYRDWQLVRLTPESALFARADERLRLLISASKPPVSGTNPEDER